MYSHQIPYAGLRYSLVMEDILIFRKPWVQFPASKEKKEENKMLCGVFAICCVLYQLWERQSKQSKSQPPCDLSLVKEMIPSVRSDKVVWGRVWTEKGGMKSRGLGLCVCGGEVRESACGKGRAEVSTPRGRERSLASPASERLINLYLWSPCSAQGYAHGEEYRVT